MSAQAMTRSQFSHSKAISGDSTPRLGAGIGGRFGAAKCVVVHIGVGA